MSNRRLFAIMFTDIEGYTALMQESEEQAVLFRATHRKVFNHYTEQFDGRIIQYYGDGTLSIFESAVDAVQCGIAMQRAFRNKPRIPVRIGIHSGDIMVTEEDIIGDGVNVASRVESLSVPGSVFISEKVYDEVKNSGAIQTVFLDKFKLKNVGQPLGVYAVSNEGLVVPPRKAIRGKVEKERKVSWPFILGFVLGILLLSVWGYRSLGTDPDNMPAGQSIVVLPFDNFTGQEDLEYMVQGMHASLITNLGKISSLRVISPTTSRTYKESGKSIAEIASELNVDAVVEVSVHCLGDSICIQPRILRTDPEEKQIWAGDYLEDKRRILNLYQTLSREISQKINVSLSPKEERLLAEARNIDTTAYDLYMKGQFHLAQINPVSLDRAANYFTLAIEREPDWAAPYAGMASVLQYQMQIGAVAPPEAMPKIQEYLARALELDPESADAHYQKGLAAVWAEWDWEKGEAEFRRSLELNPNNALGQMFYAHLLTILRRPDEALEHAERAKNLDPMDPLILGLYGAVLHFAAKDPGAAREQCERALSIEPGHGFASGILRENLTALGAYDEAFALWKEQGYAIWQQFGVAERYEDTYRDKGWRALMEEAIRINEEIYAPNGRLNNWRLGNLHFDLQQYEQAVSCYEKVFELHNPNLPYISSPYYYDQLKRVPAYLDLLKKMKLPM